MKTRFVFLLTITVLLFAHAGEALGQGTEFTIHGRLNGNGSPANGNYDLTFSLFDSDSGPNQVGVTITNSSVGVTNGQFTTTLDFGAGIFTGPDRWLQIYVRTNGGGAYTALNPRQKLTPTPYAITARNLSGTLPTAQLSGTLPSALLGGPYSTALTLNNPANNFTGNGAGLTGVNAATLGGLGASGFWQLNGNAGTTAGVNFVGTTDNQPLELKVNGQRAFRLEPTANSPNIIGGFSGNYAESNTVGVTISGGGASEAPNAAMGLGESFRPHYATIGGGAGNSIVGSFGTSSYGTIAGGSGNSLGAPYCTISGGGSNTVFRIPGYSQPSACTIAGGFGNRIFSGNPLDGFSTFSVISGGESNVVGFEADHSTVGGGGGNTVQTRSGSYSTIGGGHGNSISGLAANGCTIAGGLSNRVFAYAGNSIVIGGGNANISSGTGATIAGGEANEVSGEFAQKSYGTIGGGQNNSVISVYGTISGGANNMATDDYTTVGGGQSNVVGATYGTIPGGLQAAAQNYGQMAHASGQFATAGDAQTSVLVCRGTTTNATQTELFLDGVSQRMVMPTNSTWGFDILVTGRAANGDSAVYQFRGAAQNNAGISAFVAAYQKNVIAESLAAWDVALFAPATNGVILIRVNGQAATSIRWVASVRTVEVTF